MRDRGKSRSYGFATRQMRVLGLAGVMILAGMSGVHSAKMRFATGAPAPVEPIAVRAVGELSRAVAIEPAVVAAPEAPVWDLPNLDHERVDEFVQLFAGRKRGDFSRFLTRMGQYQPMISRKLEERGMPQDLIYLAMIESGFNPTAYSHAHASGIWQFISGTALRYGLDINRAVDERRDPERATDAALSYLEDLHKQFGSWYLAAAAYNTGEGRVARIMRQVTGSVQGDEYSYYKIRHRLPRETRDYVPLMVAAARIAKEPARYGFDEVEIGAPLEFDRVKVAPATPLARIAAASGTTVAEIRRLNPQLKLDRTRNDRWDEIRIPAGSELKFGPSLAAALAAASPAPASTKPKAKAKPATITYRIRRGDNLTRIARRNGTTVSALKQVNGLRGDRIRAGSTLRIPSGR